MSSNGPWIRHSAEEIERLERAGLDPALFSPRERSVLLALLDAGTTSHATLLQRVFDDLNGYYAEHILRVNVSRLRKKLPDLWRIERVPAFGYRLERVSA